MWKRKTEKSSKDILIESFLIIIPCWLTSVISHFAFSSTEEKMIRFAIVYLSIIIIVACVVVLTKRYMIEKFKDEKK